ncbi:MAG: hypothetical protein ACLR7Z_16495 [Bilophila wadsworthia]
MPVSGVAGMPLAGVITVISLFTVVIHLLIGEHRHRRRTPPALAALAGTMGVNPAVLAIPMGFSVSAAFCCLDAVPLVTYPPDITGCSTCSSPDASFPWSGSWS